MSRQKGLKDEIIADAHTGHLRGGKFNRIKLKAAKPHFLRKPSPFTGKGDRVAVDEVSEADILAISVVRTYFTVASSVG